MPSCFTHNNPSWNMVSSSLSAKMGANIVKYRAKQARATIAIPPTTKNNAFLDNLVFFLSASAHLFIAESLTENSFSSSMVSVTSSAKSIVEFSVVFAFNGIFSKFSSAKISSLCSVLLMFLFLSVYKNKKCGYRSNRTKNANSDSRQTKSI